MDDRNPRNAEARSLINSPKCRLGKLGLATPVQCVHKALALLLVSGGWSRMLVNEILDQDLPSHLPFTPVGKSIVKVLSARDSKDSTLLKLQQTVR
jgi:hypothetical protein